MSPYRCAECHAPARRGGEAWQRLCGHDGAGIIGLMSGTMAGTGGLAA